WDLLNQKGFRIGVYRPLSVWSAKEFDGFCVPNPLLLEKNTYPQNLNFIAELDIKARSEKYSISFMVKFFLETYDIWFPINTVS
ncbi:unnamed protein product, partial [marine sediment metagenome]